MELLMSAGLILGIQHVSKTVTRGLTKRFSAIAKETIIATASHWHEHIFPRHFGPANRSDYNFAPRTRVYLQRIKPKKGIGIGKFRDMVLTGEAMRRMRFVFRISGYAGRVTVKMDSPTYFFRPFRGNYIDPRTGKPRKIYNHPDKPDEVTRHNERDRQELQTVAKEFLAQKMLEARPETQVLNLPAS
jgi:hypothetical protein